MLDIGVQRYSSPFFLEATYSATIPSNLIAPDQKQVEPPIVYGVWLVKKLQQYVEWQSFKMPDMSGRCRDSKGNIIIKEAKKPQKKLAQKLGGKKAAPSKKVAAKKAPKKISKPAKKVPAKKSAKRASNKENAPRARR